MSATKEEYEKLVLFGLKDGDVVRVPVSSDKEYNSQRMIVYRILRKLIDDNPANRSQWVNIKVGKVVDETGTYLQITKPMPRPATFMFQSEDGSFVEKNLETVEEAEFAKWLLSDESKG